MLHYDVLIECLFGTFTFIDIKKMMKRRKEKERRGRSVIVVYIVVMSCVCVCSLCIKDRVKSFATTYIFHFLPIHLAKLQPLSPFDLHSCLALVRGGPI